MSRPDSGWKLQGLIKRCPRLVIEYALGSSKDKAVEGLPRPERMDVRDDGRVGESLLFTGERVRSGMEDIDMIIR